jgi:hypothetical protein
MTEGDAGRAEGSTPPEETAPEAEGESEVDAGASESTAAREPLPDDDVDGDVGEIEDDDAYEAALTSAATEDADAEAGAEESPLPVAPTGPARRFGRPARTVVPAAPPTPSEVAVRIDDRISALYVIAVVAAFTGLLLWGVFLGTGGILTPLPSPSPSPTEPPASAEVSPSLSPSPSPSPSPTATKKPTATPKASSSP